MDIFKLLRTFVLTCIICCISGCLYYYPDLKGESAGSLLGGFAVGIAVAEIATDITVWGAGTIVGSVLGGMIGQEIDNTSPLRLENPPNEPVPLFYYKTMRAPFVYEYFTPGGIIYGKCKNQTELRPITNITY